MLSVHDPVAKFRLLNGRQVLRRPSRFSPLRNMPFGTYRAAAYLLESTLSVHVWLPLTGTHHQAEFLSSVLQMHARYCGLAGSLLVLHR